MNMIAQLAGGHIDNPHDLGSNPRSYKSSYYFSNETPMRFSNVGV